MKIRTIILALAVGVSAALTGSAFAQTATPGLNKQEVGQQARINQGVASGQLIPKEAGQLQRRENRLVAHTQRAKADGVVTRGERHRLQREAKRNSHYIYHKKHNAHRMHRHGRAY